MSEILDRLRGNDPVARAGLAPGSRAAALLEQLASQGVPMAATGGPLEDVWHRALADLTACIHPAVGDQNVLHEGGVYRGTWIESTGTINAEVLARFLPTVARDTYLLFADGVRADGLLPYKVTDAGPSYRQIQIVTPLARSVWHHHRLYPDPAFLRRMYDAMVRNDAWLAAYRDTRGTGCVEAFCAFLVKDVGPRCLVR